MQTTNKFILPFLLLFTANLAHGTPRAYLQTNSGYVQPDTLHIGDKAHKTSNYFTSTFDIVEFDYLKQSDPNAYQALHNHYRYGVVGTRGLLLGIGVSATTVVIFKNKVHPMIPITTFLAGFIYYMNCRYMARHYLHNAINTLNGVSKSQLQKRTTTYALNPTLAPDQRSAIVGLSLDITY